MQDKKWKFLDANIVERMSEQDRKDQEDIGAKDKNLPYLKEKNTVRVTSLEDYKKEESS